MNRLHVDGGLSLDSNQKNKIACPKLQFSEGTSRLPVYKNDRRPDPIDGEVIFNECKGVMQYGYDNEWRDIEDNWESLLIAIAGDKESYPKEEVLHAMWMTEQETIWENSPHNPMNEDTEK